MLQRTWKRLIFVAQIALLLIIVMIIALMAITAIVVLPGGFVPLILPALLIIAFILEFIAIIVGYFGLHKTARWLRTQKNRSEKFAQNIQKWMRKKVYRFYRTKLGMITRTKINHSKALLQRDLT